MQVKIKGWDFLSSDIQEKVNETLRKNGLDWVIVSDSVRDRYDILMDVDAYGHDDLNEHAKAYLGALIYLLLWAELSSDSGLAGLALNMTHPGKTLGGPSI